jgi:hypothetical protein
MLPGVESLSAPISMCRKMMPGKLPMIGAFD